MHDEVRFRRPARILIGFWRWEPRRDWWATGDGPKTEIRRWPWDCQQEVPGRMRHHVMVDAMVVDAMVDVETPRAYPG